MREEAFVFEGHPCTLICPDSPAPGNPWVWRAEFLGAFDDVDRELLKKGWHIAYCDLHDQYGCDYAIEEMKKFHDHLLAEYRFSPRADIFGFSRGGLYAFRYALTYPQDLNTVYLDAPVLDIKSWPAGLGDSKGYAKGWEECKVCYGIDDESIAGFSQNPIDHLREYVRLRIPTVLVAGDADDVVPLHENGAFLQAAMEAADIERLVIVKPGCGHHPHSLRDPHSIVAFIQQHAFSL